MSSSRSTRVVIAALAAASLAAGCGFHLRGDVTYAFPTLYVSSPATQPLVTELKRTLDSIDATHVVATARRPR